MQKPRLPASSSASKLAVPRPVNLPSLRKVRCSRHAPVWIHVPIFTLSGRRVTGRSAGRHGSQENAGNDPNTQIVPSGSGTSWQKVEEAPPAPADPKTALTAGSTWASTQSKESGWQPPAPAISSLPPPRPGSRRLNPHEYPSLSAAASGRQQSLPKQRVPVVPDAQVMHQSPPRSCIYQDAFEWHGWREYIAGKQGDLMCKPDLKSWFAYRDWQTGMRMRGASPQCNQVSLMAQTGQSHQLDFLHPAKFHLHV